MAGTMEEPTVDAMREAIGRWPETYHIRRRLRKAGGNQWYRDKSNRGQGTFCGAPETAYDFAWRDKPVPWNGRVPCAQCVALQAVAHTEGDA